MRTKTLFNNINAFEAATSDILNFDEQDARFLIQILGTNLVGTPRIIVEESIDQTMWSIMEDTTTWFQYFDVGMLLTIKDNYFMGKYFRIRLDPNSCTAGTIKALIGYKTKP